MNFFKKKNTNIVNEKKFEKLNTNLENCFLEKDINVNISLMNKLFENVSTIKTRKIKNNFNPNLGFFIIYCEGLINSKIINDNIIKPLIITKVKNKKNLLEIIETELIQTNELKRTGNIKDIIEAVTYGQTMLFIDGYNEGLLLNTQKFKSRAITEPENEKIIMGPREGFNECLLDNVAMIQRKLRTNEFKIEYKTIGNKTNTKIAICYIEGIVKKEILNELKQRLSKIDIDVIVDSNYIIELIKDNKYSPFRTIGNTEKPDVVVGKMFEGRIAIVVDGTPMVLTLPYLFIENFQSGEDYYLGPYYTSFSRIIRILGFLGTCTIPSLYIAIVAFHHEMIPTSLFLNITMERQSVPLPASIEAIILLILFEVLKETGIRMPTGVGQALSIVGALVIGQAAVEAKLVAAPMIIIVGVTGITSLLIPKLNAANIMIRFSTLIISSLLGLFGLLIATCFWLIHVLNLSSFGVESFNFLEKGWLSREKDTIIRMPWSKM